jgi:hypothetical protein
VSMDLYGTAAGLYGAEAQAEARDLFPPFIRTLFARVDAWIATHPGEPFTMSADLLARARHGGLTVASVALRYLTARGVDVVAR